MIDEELEAIKRRKLMELQKRLAQREKRTAKIDKEELLKKVFVGRAWEVWRTAQLQYPEAMRKIEELFVKLILSRRLTRVDGVQLYTFLRRLGLRVKLKTEIRIREHGELKSLSEKLRGKL